MESDQGVKSQPFHHGLAKTRDQALDLRVKVQASHGKIKNCMRYFDESREEFMAAIQSVQPGQPLEAPQIEALKKVDERLKEDSDALKTAMEELRLLHFNLSNLDFALFNEETKHGAQGYLDRLLSSGEAAPSTIEPMIVGADTSHDDDSLPPLLAQYFDALGDISLLTERLDYDLVQEQVEKVAHRERRRDQEDTLSTTDSEFHFVLHHERKNLERELEQATELAARLKKECTMAGLDPDPEKYARQSEGGSSVSRHQDDVTRWLGNVGDEIQQPGIDHLQDVYDYDGRSFDAQKPTTKMDIAQEHELPFGELDSV